MFSIEENLELKSIEKVNELDLLHKEIIEEYVKEESKIKTEYLLDKITYVSPVNFRESMETPRHRWFPYKEGFSPSFVRDFIREYSPINAKTLLDPFSGVGTTLIEGGKLGLNTYGFDVSPLSYFITQVKMLSFSSSETEELNNCIEKFKIDPLDQVASGPDNETVKSYFDSNYLTAILQVKFFLNEIVNKKVHMLFKLAFLGSLEYFSTHRKAGNGVKRKTQKSYDAFAINSISQVRLKILEELATIKDDILVEPTIPKSNIVYGSCLDKSLYPNDIKFDVILTSPPYANCFDYSKIYMIELWLGDFFIDKDGQKFFRAESLRSHVHAKWEPRHTSYGIDLINTKITKYLSLQKLWSKQIPHMIKGYFDDMGFLLKTLADKCNDDATIGIVVGNSFYGQLPIATDVLLCMLGRQYGLTPQKIVVYRNIIGSSQQYSKVFDKKYMRESLIIFKK